MSKDGTHLIVCKNPEALEWLKKEEIILGIDAEKGNPVEQGDALVARDELQAAGYVWGKDFYLKKVTS